MTIPMDSAVSFTVGHVFAIAGRDAIREDPEKEKACLKRGRLFQTFVIVPLRLYFLVRWPDWAWMYLAGEHARSPALAALGMSFYLVAHEIGFRNATRLIKAGRTDEAVIHGLASLSILAIISALGWRRFRWQGTLEEYKAGTAVDVFRNPDFQVSMAVAGATAIALASRVIARNHS